MYKNIKTIGSNLHLKKSRDLNIKFKPRSNHKIKSIHKVQYTVRTLGWFHEVYSMSKLILNVYEDAWMILFQRQRIRPQRLYTSLLKNKTDILSTFKLNLH